MRSPLLPLLSSFSWRELLHHPWRNAAAVISVTLGVALAFSVHTINASALAEFSQAVRAVNGKADLELRALTSATADSPLNDALLSKLMRYPGIATAAPILEFSTLAQSVQDPSHRIALKLIGTDVLHSAKTTPELLPLPAPGRGRFDYFSPNVVYLNASASAALLGTDLLVQRGLQLLPVQVGGRVRASGAPMAIMDIAAAQELADMPGVFSRIDLTLEPGVQRDALATQLRAMADWPAQVELQEPADAQQRIGNLSQAYRVNLTVLALVALFTGSFLVFSVLALSVSRRSQQFALLAVLGLTSQQRVQLVLLEAGLLGLVGSILGILLGTALSHVALQWLGGDLGGGYFASTSPKLHWSWLAALTYACLGLFAALIGAWWPARRAGQLPAAQTLKGLGMSADADEAPWIGIAMLVGAGGMALLPPVGGIALAAYVSVALLLLGGIATLPWIVGALLQHMPAWVHRHPVPLLAVERAHHMRESAAVSVSGVVASLSLAVALTVMVASFRTSVNQWLDTVLPAALYVRTAANLASTETAYFSPEFVRAAENVPGVDRLAAQRSRAMQWAKDKPPVTLIARVLQREQDSTAASGLPLIGAALPVPAGHIGVYVSEAVVDLYGARPGTSLEQLKPLFAAATTSAALPGPNRSPRFFVAGVWRDYARQFGTVAMDLHTYQELSHDLRINDIAFWLTPQADMTAVQAALRKIADMQSATPDGSAGRQLEFGSATQIRANTMNIFDRSFAVTYWLQAVAIGIGLFGVAASFSAQVLARRKEFGLLVHLGLTRRQVLGIVALEGATWTLLGSLAGWALGLAVAAILIHVVNPQSFHWTMDMAIPCSRLLALGLAVVVAGTLTAWLCGRSAASQNAVLAVKEDW